MKRFLFVFIFIISVLVVQSQTTGNATYYGKKFNNRKTASGEIYRQDSMVCAHRTYPFGRLLHVKNMKNGKEVVVRVIDRGPFRKKCIIDLSLAAAKELDMVRHGVVPVEVSEYTEEVFPKIVSDTVCVSK
ncbi:rare lipoprotein A [Dysgonomonas sp. PFB1-18]|uniref:septal ring lytic transglycosylase RlpA family protein n=1 Tax=unclassified Dysgonomonas TaxID=2630389 RepID=UPI0024732A3F|nr:MULTISPECIES: septal ring lytic transglycosylase RlpA family protein [unclassified Dysgonomonas]MDH6308822.1 rare lipoprotein A [Dysgonomonas sp. PF1-14]MDH6338482.1 rare lipoprotein A [Dysgonomonas sp. PF1-16]MDH6380071.1 rare lipoprotein A [Dysgonomonas sp. PFB1-18]MDH6397310.1 rare lipoprotein A [Dysgonomonas sp. PF1-23]